MTAYVLKQLTHDGLWTSEPHEPDTDQHIRQAVIAGLYGGEPRWAETLDGAFIVGFGANGMPIKEKPAQSVPVHTKDSDCTVVDSECTVCGVTHVEWCSRCDGRGFHNADCEQKED